MQSKLLPSSDPTNNLDNLLFSFTKIKYDEGSKTKVKGELLPEATNGLIILIDPGVNYIYSITTVLREQIEVSVLSRKQIELDNELFDRICNTVTTNIVEGQRNIN